MARRHTQELLNSCSQVASSYYTATQHELTQGCTHGMEACTCFATILYDFVSMKCAFQRSHGYGKASTASTLMVEHT